jgi:BirA family biotin operon repressor/biotin-[acetyl-CoA-carboxylase] ligase
LEIGLALWEATAAMLPPASRANLRLKWPNDLLWEGRKSAGMLIETTTDHIFAGVGINISEAPEVLDGGTHSARLTDAGLGEEAGLELAKSFGGNLRDRLSPADPPDVASRRAIVEEWRARAQWDTPLRLRDRPARPEVLPVDINADGPLKVRFADGREEWLASEYLA